jgi:DNA-binding MarR family transcriptional regulator
MVATLGTEPERAAAVILDVLPLGSRWLRAQVRSQEPSWSLPQLHALGYLRRCPGASLSELAGYLGIGLPTASTLVSRLVNAGYLERVEDPAERRKVSLSLTDRGQGRFYGALDLARGELAERLGRLSPRDLAKVTVAAAQLRKIFEDAPPERAG